MKEGFDKEIDSLLRRRARGVAESFADGDGAGSAASSHLDADELGAFAEGALPAPARLAAASHLADCDRCRGVAVALSRALGGGVESKQAAVAVPASTAAKRPAGWRAWAAAFFSPRAMRFAAPVLALSVVAVVSYVALRTRQGGALDNTKSPAPQAEVAQVRPGAAPDTATTATTANANLGGLVVSNAGETSGNPNASAPAPRQSSEGRGPNAGETHPVTVDSVTVTAEDTSAPPPPSPSAPSATPEAPPEIAKTATRPAAVEGSEQPSKSDDRDKAKSARDADSDAASNDYSVREQQRRAAQNRAAELQMPDGGARNQRRAENNVSNIYGSNAGTSAAPKEAEREARGGAATATRRSRSTMRAEQKAEEDETTRVGDTREAAGHRFRREGSAWVDVKYKRNMRSTGVRRGSESFRALVADVPVVGRVAEQISGEVIVVVGGHAYRIR